MTSIINNYTKEEGIKMNEIDFNEITERDNLAVVYKVESLEPIAGKDRIELVHLKDCGYTTICEKGHKVGDLVVFIKYDTVVPDNELFTFMKDNKFRVKAKSFTEKNHDGWVTGKIYSQGIVLPLKSVTNFLDNILNWDLKEGNDVTSELGVKKYIPPVQGSGTSFGDMQSSGSFPTEIVSKTDELNICTYMNALDEIKGKPVYITQKLEGSSITCGYDLDGEFFVCSRNNKLKENDNKFWEGVANSDLKQKLSNIPDIIVQGELVGPGIQKNKLGLSQPFVFVFNMIDKTSRRRLNWHEMEAIEKQYQIALVPICCELSNFDWSFDKLQKYADIQKYSNGETAEGIVIRPQEPFYSDTISGDWSLKVINRNYSL